MRFQTSSQTRSMDSDNAELYATVAATKVLEDIYASMVADDTPRVVRMVVLHACLHLEADARRMLTGAPR